MRGPGNLLILLGVSTCSTVLAASSEASSRPRGVGPEFAKFYKDTTTFSCISHPAVKIPFSAVNDDYCDCPDGSDEPGTSACSHLSRLSPLTPGNHPDAEGIDLTPALPGFHCKNKGHTAAYIPFQRVNDGICDYDICCDGSDEWARVGGTKCEDRCKEIGKSWRKAEETRQKSLTAALRKKKELVAESGRLTKEIEDRIIDLEVEVKAQETKIRAMEVDLERLEKEERGKVVKSTKKGKVAMLAGLAKTRVNELREALNEVRSQRDDSRSRVKELEEILATFKVEYNPNFNDEGVKRAVRSWEDYAAKGTAGDFSSEAAKDRDYDEITKEDSEVSGVDWAHWENQDDASGGVDILYKLLAYLPPAVVEFLEDKFYSIKKFLVDNNIIPSSNNDPSSESKALKEARDSLKAEQSLLDRTVKSIKDHKADLEKDYGAQGIFRTLKDVCIQKDSGEYTYEHCFLSKTKQIPKKGGATVTMGNYQGIVSITMDDVNTAGEIQQVEKVALEYKSGQQCWNGPARSTMVILECAEENEILKVMEDEKCVYSMIVTTPAVCGDVKVKESRKDEL
ncbi:glucosidase II beta subunit-like protein-domain-containing protein [Talaromyces proteolyticus]|uniref:Glucosidase 2 subunit beta n=1 Tax=Talaromyces proteolyticus TaxID=1131652 RepID=A0AAD4PWN3_9EURO|nr:glucosidase II beta subunit-like protein-domain-containing protein [Talaromyces proteolyticus]KAH8698322.1 glucosidase II beta subunit-like protein-domain-containing protein [Talaromyces proteolyticus]